MIARDESLRFRAWLLLSRLAQLPELAEGVARGLACWRQIINHGLSVTVALVLGCPLKARV